MGQRCESLRTPAGITANPLVASNSAASAVGCRTHLASIFLCSCISFCHSHIFCASTTCFAESNVAHSFTQLSNTQAIIVAYPLLSALLCILIRHLPHITSTQPSLAIQTLSHTVIRLHPNPSRLSAPQSAPQCAKWRHASLHKQTTHQRQLVASRRISSIARSYRVIREWNTTSSD